MSTETKQSKHLERDRPVRAVTVSNQELVLGFIHELASDRHCNREAVSFNRAKRGPAWQLAPFTS